MSRRSPVGGTVGIDARAALMRQPLTTPRLLFVAFTAALAALAAWLAVAADDAPKAKPGPDRATIDKGRALATLGNCNLCHTTERGASFAGGRALATAFGTLYATNITPDPETGIGRWSLEDFRRAMREGLAPGGRQLYPAFPYDHYASVSLPDIDAIYAYLMTRDAVRATAPPNDLHPPYGARPLIGFWKALYFHPQAIVPDPARGADWNRGRYLVDGIAHCGACHTPRNGLGAEDRERDLAGGAAEGWHAPALDQSSPAPVNWTVDALVVYLRSGFDPSHGAARGPMAPVTRNLANVPEADVQAIAVYIASRAGQSKAGPAVAVKREQIADPPGGSDEGAVLFEGACAGCHNSGTRGVRLENSTAVTDVVPTNMVRVIADGVSPAEGEPSRSMPGFRGALTAAQTVAVARYVRSRYSRAAPWTDLEGEVNKVLGQRPSGSAS